MQLVFELGKDKTWADTLSRSCFPDTEAQADSQLDPLLQVFAIVIRSDEVMSKCQSYY